GQRPVQIPAPIPRVVPNRLIRRGFPLLSAPPHLDNTLPVPIVDAIRIVQEVGAIVNVACDKRPPQPLTEVLLIAKTQPSRYSTVLGFRVGKRHQGVVLHLLLIATGKSFE